MQRCGSKVRSCYCACYKEKQARNVVRYAGGPPLQWRAWLASPRDVSNYAMILSEMPKEYYWSPSPNYSPTAPHCQQSKAKENSLLGGSHENCWWHANPKSLYISRTVKVYITQTFVKSSPYFWLQYIQLKVRWRFRKILWPSQNTRTLLLSLVFSLARCCYIVFFLVSKVLSPYRVFHELF